MNEHTTSQAQQSTTVTIDAVEACLAQTQCTECGYSGCRPYAEAIVEKDAEINRCRPGGEWVIAKLANLLNKPVAEPLQEPLPFSIAVVDEQVCIGCTKCIQACPTDAIIGAPKMKHTVIDVQCSSCRLCVPMCPVDCIDMVEDHSFQNTPARAQEISIYVQKRKDRMARQVDRELKDIEDKLLVDVPQQSLPSDVMAKIAEARQASHTKWTEKKTASVPKLLQDKERGTDA